MDNESSITIFVRNRIFSFLIQKDVSYLKRLRNNLAYDSNSPTIGLFAPNPHFSVKHIPCVRKEASVMFVSQPWGPSQRICYLLMGNVLSLQIIYLKEN